MMKFKDTTVVPLRAAQGKIASHDEKDIETLIQESLPELKRYLWRTLSANEDVEDVLQEVYCRILEDNRLPVMENPRAFLYTTAKNILIDRYRKRQNQIDSGNRSPVEKHESPYVNSFFNYDEMVSAYEMALAELPDKCRRVFLLRRYDGLSNAEISRKLDISMRMVQKHLAKALKHFHHRLR